MAPLRRIWEGLIERRGPPPGEGDEAPLKGTEISILPHLRVVDEALMPDPAPQALKCRSVRIGAVSPTVLHSYSLEVIERERLGFIRMRFGNQCTDRLDTGWCTQDPLDPLLAGRPRRGNAREDCSCAVGRSRVTEWKSDARSGFSPVVSVSGR